MSDIAPPVVVVDDETNATGTPPPSVPLRERLAWRHIAFIAAGAMVAAAFVLGIVLSSNGEGRKSLGTDGKASIGAPQGEKAEGKTAAVSAAVQPGAGASATAATVSPEAPTAATDTPPPADTVEAWRDAVTTTMNNHEAELYGDSPVASPSRIDAAEERLKALEAKITELEKLCRK